MTPTEHPLMDTNNYPPDFAPVILVFNTSYLGDALLCNALCQDIREAFPRARIVFVTDRKFTDAAAYQKDVDEVIPFDKKGAHKGFFGALRFIKDFPYRRPFAAFITYKNERNALIARFIGTRFIFTSDDTFPGKVQDRHCAPLEKALGRKFLSKPICYEPPELSPGLAYLKSMPPYVVISPVSKNLERDLDPAWCAEVLKLLSAKGVPVVLSGVGARVAPHEAALKASGLPFTDLVGKTSIAELGAVLKASRGVISADTGSLHLAAAVGAKTVGIFKKPGQIPLWAPDESLYNCRILTGEASPKKAVEALSLL